jgi:acyl carrier protein
MGLDTVELVMRIEEEFSIDLPDAELENVRTVGDLYQVVLDKLETTPSCLSSKAFYRVRRALVECLNLSRRVVRPSTLLDSLMPRASLIQHWQKIADHTGLALPALKRRRNWADSFLGPFGSSSYRIQTVGDLASSVLTLNYPEFAPASEKGSKPTAEDVWIKLVDIFCDQLGVDPDQVQPSATIADDLGVD